jgi:hypothetical protein
MDPNGVKAKRERVILFVLPGVFPPGAGRDAAVIKKQTV